MAQPIINLWHNIIGKDQKMRNALCDTLARLELMHPRRKLPPKIMRRIPKKPGPVKYGSYGLGRPI